MLLVFVLSLNNTIPSFIFDSNNTFEVHLIKSIDQTEIDLKYLAQKNMILLRGFRSYYTRTKHLGLSGRAWQSQFTVACAFSHILCWHKFLDISNDFALILEDDAHPVRKTSLTHTFGILNSFKQNNISWDVIQLGRCWDFCSTEKTLFKFYEHRIVNSDSACCTHSYLVSRIGAKKLLRYSLPHITSIDLLITLLARMHIIQMYSVSPPLFTQIRSDIHHDSTLLLECDPNESNLRKLQILDTNVLNILINKNKHSNHVNFKKNL